MAECKTEDFMQLVSQCIEDAAVDYGRLKAGEDINVIKFLGWSRVNVKEIKESP